MVTPTDKLRFGLTCRYVKPEMVPEDMRSLGDFTLDPADPYDGDVKLYDDYIEKVAKERDEKIAKEREKRMLAKSTASVVATSA